MSEPYTLMPENAAENQEPEPEPQSTGSFAFPAQIQRGTRAGGGVNAAELLDIVRERAPDPEAIDEASIFFFRAIISTAAQDSYFTMMHSSSLQNFANEATEGRSFLEGHNTRSRPLGQSLRGRYVGASSSGKARTEADFFIAPEPSGMGRKADMIHEIRTGTARDVSVGFSLGEDGMYRCNLCKRDYMGGECKHFLGTDWEGWDGKTENGQICTCTIENGHLNETSSVYDGATPGAAILKAIRAMEEGRLTPEMARVLEPMYRVNLHGARHTWAGAMFPDRKTASDRGRLTAQDTPSGSLAAVNVQAAIAELRASGSALDINALLNVAVVDRGLDADRGEPGIAQRLYISTDSNRIFYDDGKDWQLVLVDSRSLATHSNREEGSMPEENTRAPENGQEPPNPPAPAAEPPPATEAARETPPPAFTAPAPAEERTITPAEWTSEQYAERVNTVLAGREIPAAEMAECVRRLSAECVTLRQLQPLAEDGKAYRAAVLEEALTQRARVERELHDREAATAIYERYTVAELLRATKVDKATADAYFGSGRVTVDTYESAPPPAEPVRVPAAAYRG